MRWLLNHGADANARTDDDSTPLCLANWHPEPVQALLEHKADVNSRNSDGKTPLFDALSSPYSDDVADVVQRLREHGVDANICDYSHSNPLHHALPPSPAFLPVLPLPLRSHTTA